MAFDVPKRRFCNFLHDDTIKGGYHATEIEHRLYLCPMLHKKAPHDVDVIQRGIPFYHEQAKLDLTRDPTRMKPFDAHVKPAGFERPLLPYSIISSAHTANVEEEDMYMRGRFVLLVFAKKQEFDKSDPSRKFSTCPVFRKNRKII
jgi:hypothetical protein